MQSTKVLGGDVGSDVNDLSALLIFNGELRCGRIPYHAGALSSLITEPERGTPSTIMQVVKQRFARKVLQQIRRRARRRGQLLWDDPSSTFGKPASATSTSGTRKHLEKTPLHELSKAAYFGTAVLRRRLPPSSTLTRVNPCEP
jgi:hypothetical protein